MEISEKVFYPTAKEYSDLEDHICNVEQNVETTSDALSKNTTGTITQHVKTTVITPYPLPSVCGYLVSETNAVPFISLINLT
jgi:hypothetical protein